MLSIKRCAIIAVNILFAEQVFSTIETKIVNGVEAPKNAYPWYSQIVSAGYLCGATLISSEWLLTAAHCIDEINNKPSTFDIGKYCYESNNCGQPHERITVAKRIVHPDYDDYSQDNDFALVKLSAPSSISPIRIDDHTYSESYSNNKPNIWAIGMGTTFYGGGVSSLPSVLHHVELKYITNESCTNDYGYSPVDITPNMMCAADIENGNRQDSCSGDSGGPLYDPEHDVLVGVVSWGVGCAEENYPGVYSRVSSQIEWIKDTVCSDHTENSLPDWCQDISSPPTVEDCQTAQLTLLTDAYPEEISWILENSDGSEVARINNGYYKMPGISYQHQFCLAPCTTYKFKIFDSWGDGLCSISQNGKYSWEIEGKGSELSPGEPCGWNDQTFQFNSQCNHDGISLPNECMDSDLEIWISSKTGFKSCTWVQENVEMRCRTETAKSACPVTCKLSEYCEKDSKRFKLRETGKGRSCNWVSRNKGSRCKKENICDTCRSTCAMSQSCLS